MLSPMMTVFVLAVLWLIVVVPMLVRRSDERRRERSVAGFGAMMRALGRGARDDARPDVFVPRERRVPTAAPARLISTELISTELISTELISTELISTRLTLNLWSTRRARCRAGRRRLASVFARRVTGVTGGAKCCLP